MMKNILLLKIMKNQNLLTKNKMLRYIQKGVFTPISEVELANTQEYNFPLVDLPDLIQKRQNKAPGGVLEYKQKTSEV